MWQAAGGLVGIMVVIFIFGMISFPRSKKVRPSTSISGLPSKATERSMPKTNPAVQQAASGKGQPQDSNFGDQKISMPSQVG